MPRVEHVALVKRGTDAINEWRLRHPHERLLLDGVDLGGMDLSRANLSNSDLRNVRFYDANLNLANLSRTYLHSANCFHASLRRTNLAGATLKDADLRCSDLRGACLADADCLNASFAQADLRGANLTDSGLGFANLVRTDLRRAKLLRASLGCASLIRTNVDGAVLTDCFAWGVAAWKVRGTPADQSNLIITPSDEPDITVDSLQLAQFIYLLLHNPEIREVIDTVTSKVVLILGRFSDEQKPVLDAIREDLRKRNLAPVLFDFDKPTSKDVTGTVETLARMARFILADLTDPSSIPHELATIVPHLRTTPVQPLRLRGSTGYTMLKDYQRDTPHRVLPTHEYDSPEQLIATLPDVIAPVDKKAEELRRT